IYSYSVRSLVGGGWEESWSCPQRDVNESDEDGHFDERTDDSGQCLSGGDAVRPDRQRDGEFEVVAGRSECQGRRLLVAQPQRLADDHPEREDDDEVHEQGQGDAGDIARMRGDLVALEGEEQDD